MKIKKVLYKKAKVAKKEMSFKRIKKIYRQNFK